MVVISLSDCPPCLRGDLSKWLFEINTGIYVGNINARVREELWTRIHENIGKGRATMVFSSSCEQHFDFKVINTTWKPVDFEGIKIMQRVNHKDYQNETILHVGYSNASKLKKMKRMKRVGKDEKNKNIIAIDIETTGLDCVQDDIIEIGAIKIVDDIIVDKLSVLVHCKRKIPNNIISITGITNEMLESEGIALSEALEIFRKFIGKSTIIGYNIQFDCSFLQEAFAKCNMDMFTNKCIDILPYARKKIMFISDYKLSTVADYYKIVYDKTHRSLDDSLLVYEVYKKLELNLF